MSAPYSQRKTASNEALMTAFGEWLSRFTASMLGVFFGGLLLLLVVRWYVQQQAAEAIERLNKPNNSAKK
jgi:preprotein translocase subunit SecG